MNTLFEQDKEYEDILKTMSDMMEQNRQLLIQNQQLAYAAQHPIATHFNEMKESVRNAVKWCDERMDELDTRIAEFKGKIANAKERMKLRIEATGEMAIGAIVDRYQRAVDRLEAAKSKIKEFKDNLISKMKDLTKKPAELWKDGISHIKEFTQNTLAKLNESLSRTHSDNARGHEDTAKRIADYEQSMFIVKQGLSNAVHALRGEPKIDVEFKPSKFLKRWQEKLLEDAKKDHDLALKYDYKATMNHIKAGMESDKREFKDFDDTAFER